jgi:tellurite resistance protein TerC
VAHPLWHWVVFIGFVLVLLALDLGVFHRKAHSVSIKEAAGWSVVWVTISLLFNLGIYFFWHRLSPASPLSNSTAALEFLTGYVVEKALSVDNIFVFVVIFTYFGVPAKYQHRVLFWGILGALLMRGAMIWAGTELLEQFHWIIYVFGAFLIFTGIKLAFSGDEEVHPERNPMIKLVRRAFHVTNEYHGQKFFIRAPVTAHAEPDRAKAGVPPAERASGADSPPAPSSTGGTRLMVTPLLLVLVIVETTDLLFAVDSIPAVFAVTKDPFIIFTSNVFAILGLRALYFLLAGVMDKFHYLKLGLSAVLTFVGLKMVSEPILHRYHRYIPTSLSLGIIAGILTLAVVASLLRAKRREKLGLPPEKLPLPVNPTDRV